MISEIKQNYEIKNWKNFEKNSLKGFFTLQFLKIGMEIRDCQLYEKNGKRWIKLPSKTWTDAQGMPVKDETGKVKYTNIVKFYEDEKYYQMQQDVIELIEYLRLIEIPNCEKTEDWGLF